MRGLVVLGCVAAMVMACGSDPPPVTMDATTQDVAPDTTVAVDTAPPDTVAPMDVDPCPDAMVQPDGGCAPRCAPTERLCGTACAGSSDPAFGCAGPGCAPCAIPNAMSACRDGACTLAACNPGYADCDMNPANGCEVNTASDPMNCGMCGRGCSVANGTAGCAMGACTVASCGAGFGDCDMTAANGCERPTTADVMNCGACGAVCAAPNATPACAMGACGVGACNAGFGNCDGMAANGCETPTATEVANCGMCGRVCTLPNAPTVGCAMGACTVMACAENFGNCDGMAANGCESDLRTTAAHCGMCGAACRPPNATGLCRAGACAIDRCNTGFADCDSDPFNGCETDIGNSPNNCGACGRVCVLPNAAPACRAGACAVGTCELGYADCDAAVTNGCEVNTGGSVAHCGACRRVCAVANGTPLCDEGRCQVDACSPGFSNCNASPTDGCESDTRVDPLNCGGCGTVCRYAHGVPRCAASTCDLASCESGYGNCNGDVGDGCEVDLTRDPGFCGGCRATPCVDVCVSGACAACNTTTQGRPCTGGRICMCTGSDCACRAL